MSFYGNIFTKVKDAYIKAFKVKTNNSQKELNLTSPETVTEGQSQPFSVEMTVKGENGIITDINDKNEVIIDASQLKQKQTEWSKSGSTTQTITKVEQNANGEVTVTYSNIAFPAKPSAIVENGILKLTFPQ